MPLVQEELVLLALVLVALALLALGLAELVSPRPRRRIRPPLATPPVPPTAAPPPVAEAQAPPPLSIETLIEQATELGDFPLRALVLLRRAEEQVGRLVDEPARIEALQARLTAAHGGVGCRLYASGLAEQAVAPLIRAVSHDALGGEERWRARAALAGALGDIAEQRGLAIRRLARDGKATAALAHADRLLGLLRSALESGLTEGELAVALVIAQRVFAHLGVHRVIAREAISPADDPHPA